MCSDIKRNENDALLSLKITRGEATSLYGLSHGSYTIRIHLKMDRPIEPDLMRIAIDKTAKRYPYFCVTLKKNERNYYFDKNDTPVALLHTRDKITLNSEETNGHIWAVCYDDDCLFIDMYHGRTDGTGLYFLISTLLYYYLDQQCGISDCTGIRTLDTPITEQEVHDPLDDLPLLDLSNVKRAPIPTALSVMEASGLKRTDGQGITLKLMIPEKAFIPFSRENDASPGIMICALMSRAIRRVHPDIPEPVIGSYVVNARPMLHAEETFHNCTNRVILEYDERVRSMPLVKQCTVFRGKTFLQSDADRIRQVMTFSSSVAQKILDLPTVSAKAQAAGKFFIGALRAATYTVSYVGKWKFPQLGEHIKEFWTETPVGSFPMIELAAANGQICVTIMQSFSERLYYDALIDELKEQGIPYTECGEQPIHTADIVM